VPGSPGAEEARLACEGMKMKWLEVVEAHTIDAHNEAWTAFIDTYEAQHPDVVHYLRDTYLIHKHEFCKAWIKDIPHYGVRTTSPLESLHGVLKAWIQVSTLDLDLVVNKIQIAVGLQLKKIRDNAAMEGTYISTHHKQSKIKIFPPLLHESVSRYALDLIVKQYRMAIRRDDNTGQLIPLKPCSGVFNTIYKLPCCHHIRQFILLRPSWTLDRRDIGHHWYFERPQDVEQSIIQPILGLPAPLPARNPAVLPPNNVRKIGRPRLDNTDKTTRRNPSHWEQLAQTAPTPQISQQNTAQQPRPLQASTRTIPTVPTAATPATIDLTANSEPQQLQQPRRRGRPPGSKNKATAAVTTQSGRIIKETSKKKASKFESMTKAQLITLLHKQGEQLNLEDDEEE
jgi:hypothetical protein